MMSRESESDNKKQHCTWSQRKMEAISRGLACLHNAPRVIQQ